MRTQFNKSKAILLGSLWLGLVLAFQNCQQTQFSFLPQADEKSPVSSSIGGGGNGDGYGGKLRILHHYVDGFQCEGRGQPESILITQNQTDWVIIRNSAVKCAFEDQVAVTGVVYDDLKKEAQFENKTYVAPKPYVVDPNEDPNLPDIKIIDGVCEDINGKCSLRAATENASLASYTASSKVVVPAASYRLTKSLDLHAGTNGHTVTVTGDGPTLTILDGQNQAPHIRITGESGSVTLDGLRFQNGAPDYSRTGYRASSLTIGFAGTLVIQNSIFSNNNGGSVLQLSTARNTKTEIARSQFLNNAVTGDVVAIFSSNAILFDQVLFSDNKASGGAAIGIANNTGGQYRTAFTIKNSFITKTAGIGIRLNQAESAHIENTTITNSDEVALDLFNHFADPDFLITKSTLTDNGINQRQVSAIPVYTANLNLSLGQFPNAKVVIQDSIVASNKAGRSNCLFTGANPWNINYATFTKTLLATNSLFDDGSCGQIGTGNIVGSPSLAAPSMGATRVP